MEPAVDPVANLPRRLLRQVRSAVRRAQRWRRTESRRKLFEAFRKEAPKEFQACVKGDFWIVSPCKAGFNKGGPHANYFDKYVNDVWDMYAKKQNTPSGKYSTPPLFCATACAARTSAG